MNFADRLQREAPEFLARSSLPRSTSCRSDDAEPSERGWIRFRGQQIETAINLKRVGADNFGVELPRDIGRDFRFTGRGRTDDEEERRCIKESARRALQSALRLPTKITGDA